MHVSNHTRHPVCNQSLGRAENPNGEAKDAGQRRQLAGHETTRQGEEEADAETALLLRRGETEGRLEEPGRVRGGVRQAPTAVGAGEWRGGEGGQPQRHLASRHARVSFANRNFEPSVRPQESGEGEGASQCSEGFGRPSQPARDRQERPSRRRSGARSERPSGADRHDLEVGL